MVTTNFGDATTPAVDTDGNPIPIEGVTTPIDQDKSQDGEGQEVDKEADEENEHDDSTVGAIRRKMKKRVD